MDQKFTHWVTHPEAGVEEGHGEGGEGGAGHAEREKGEHGAGCGIAKSSTIRGRRPRSRSLHELDEEEFSALLGHEVAHHLRRDTVRLGVLNTLQAVFFFQPLLRLAGRDVQYAAEEQCDEWVAGQLEDRFAMASCLTEVASWVVEKDRCIPVPCMGRRRSQLATRVTRLMDGRRTFGAPQRAWRILGSASVLVLASWLAPGVTFAETSHGEAVRSEHSTEHVGRRREHR